MYGAHQVLLDAGEDEQNEKGTIAATVCVIAAPLAFVFFVPMPFSVKCAFEIQPRKGQQVFPVVARDRCANVCIKPGDEVKTGDVLLELENADLQLQLIDHEGRYREAEEALKVLQDQGFSDTSALSQLDVAREVRDSAKKQWEEKIREAQKLTIVAPGEGTIIPPPSRPTR